MENKAALEYFRKILIDEVYLRTIEDWEKIFDGRMNSPISNQTRDVLSTLKPDQINAVKDIIPEITKTAIHFFLWNIDDSYLDLCVSLSSEQSKSLKEISSGLAGDFWASVEEFNKKAK